MENKSFIQRPEHHISFHAEVYRAQPSGQLSGKVSQCSPACQQAPLIKGGSLHTCLSDVLCYGSPVPQLFQVLHSNFSLLTQPAPPRTV